MKNEKLADAKGAHPSRLALLIAAPHDGEAGMHNDVVAMYDALIARGLSSEDILLLEGKLNRKLLMRLFGEANKRVAKWKSGEVFMHYSGHGIFTGSTVSEARVGMLLAPSKPSNKINGVFWDEVFAALHPPANINLILLPDC
ncbi:caspase family protein [candidate division KSB1 bacterium]|nr:caspase family protein [candidate division KSB1 bacterium]